MEGSPLKEMNEDKMAEAQEKAEKALEEKERQRSIRVREQIPNDMQYDYEEPEDAREDGELVEDEQLNERELGKDGVV